MITGEESYRYSFDPEISIVDTLPTTLMNDRDLRFTGMHINYLFNSKLFYVWIQEPNWQDFLNSREDIDSSSEITQSWGTFLFRQESARRRLMEIPSADSLLEMS